MSPSSDKIAVTETLYRFFAGLDERSPTLLSSSLSATAVSDFGPAARKAGFEYAPLHGRQAIISALTASLSALDTSHSVSNPRVRLDGDKAHLDAMVEAQHVLRSDAARRYLMKNRYSVELEREGEGWVIERCTVDNIWREGDQSVMAGI